VTLPTGLAAYVTGAGIACGTGVAGFGLGTGGVLVAKIGLAVTAFVLGVATTRIGQKSGAILRGDRSRCSALKQRLWLTLIGAAHLRASARRRHPPRSQNRWVRIFPVFAIRNAPPPATQRMPPLPSLAEISARLRRCCGVGSPCSHRRACLVVPSSVAVSQRGYHVLPTPLV